MVGENQSSWFLFLPLDSGWEIIKKWQGLATQVAKHGINLSTFVELWARVISMPSYRSVGMGVPEKKKRLFSFFKALLSYGDKETSRIFSRCSCIWWEARRFVSFLFLRKKLINFIMQYFILITTLLGLAIRGCRNNIIPLQNNPGLSYCSQNSGC